MVLSVLSSLLWTFVLFVISCCFVDSQIPSVSSEVNVNVTIPSAYTSFYFHSSSPLLPCQSISPYPNTPCSGHGICYPPDSSHSTNWCSCDSGWNGVSDFFSRDGVDCHMSIVAVDFLFSLWGMVDLSAAIMGMGNIILMILSAKKQKQKDKDKDKDKDGNPMAVNNIQNSHVSKLLSPHRRDTMSVHHDPSKPLNHSQHHLQATKLSPHLSHDEKHFHHNNEFWNTKQTHSNANVNSNVNDNGEIRAAMPTESDEEIAPGKHSKIPNRSRSQSRSHENSHRSQNWIHHHYHQNTQNQTETIGSPQNEIQFHSSNSPSPIHFQGNDPNDKMKITSPSNITANNNNSQVLSPSSDFTIPISSLHSQSQSADDNDHLALSSPSSLPTEKIVPPNSSPVSTLAPLHRFAPTTSSHSTNTATFDSNFHIPTDSVAVAVIAPTSSSSSSISNEISSLVPLHSQRGRYSSDPLTRKEKEKDEYQSHGKWNALSHPSINYSEHKKRRMAELYNRIRSLSSSISPSSSPNTTYRFSPSFSFSSIRLRISLLFYSYLYNRVFFFSTHSLLPFIIRCSSNITIVYSLSSILCGIATLIVVIRRLYFNVSVSYDFLSSLFLTLRYFFFQIQTHLYIFGHFNLSATILHLNSQSKEIYQKLLIRVKRFMGISCVYASVFPVLPVLANVFNEGEGYEIITMIYWLSIAAAAIGMSSGAVSYSASFHSLSIEGQGKGKGKEEKTNHNTSPMDIKSHSQNHQHPYVLSPRPLSLPSDSTNVPVSNSDTDIVSVPVTVLPRPHVSHRLSTLNISQSARRNDAISRLRVMAKSNQLISSIICITAVTFALVPILRASTSYVLGSTGIGSGIALNLRLNTMREQLKSEWKRMKEEEIGKDNGHGQGQGGDMDRHDNHIHSDHNSVKKFPSTSQLRKPSNPNPHPNMKLRPSLSLSVSREVSVSKEIPNGKREERNGYHHSHSHQKKENPILNPTITNTSPSHHQQHHDDTNSDPHQTIPLSSTFPFSSSPSTVTVTSQSLIELYSYRDGILAPSKNTLSANERNDSSTTPVPVAVNTSNMEMAGTIIFFDREK